MNTLNTTEIRLGSYVRDQYGRLGRVYDIHLHGCPEDAGWIAGQEIPVTEAEVKGVWASMLNDGGGATVAPITSLVRIAPFDTYSNPWADEYFEASS